MHIIQINRSCLDFETRKQSLYTKAEKYGKGVLFRRVLTLAMKKMILRTLVFFSLFGSISIAIAQDSANPLIALSSTEINFYGEVDTIPAARDLIVIGLEDGVNVILVPSDLYANGTGESIAVNLNITNFSVNKTSLVPVSINLSSAAKEGTYKGAIIVTATANGNITTTNLTVIATIEAVNPWLDLGQWVSVFSIGILIFIGLMFPGLVFPEDKEIQYKERKILLKKLLVVSFGIIISLILLWSLVYFDFGGPGTILNALLVTPFVTYAIAFVKDERTERLEKEKTSRTIRDDGIKKDTELIRNLMGEMATHCASFNPNFYEEKLKKPFDNTSQLLYHKTGLVARKVWDESCKQGFVADIHTLHLEKYYDFIPLYNQCYAYAMTLIKDKKLAKKKHKFFDHFEEFRKTYGELQRVLFVYLSYIQELYSKTALSPMKLEFPRITRTLLYKLIDYEILKPFKYIDNLSGFKTEEIPLGAKDLDKERKILENRAKNASSERARELKKQAKLIKKLKDRLSANQGNDKELITKSKKQFKQKMPLRDKYKKAHPELKGNKEKFNKDFKIYAWEQILEMRWKKEFQQKMDELKRNFRETHPKLEEEFKKAHPKLEEGTSEFEKEFEKYVKEKIIEESEFEVLEAVEEWVTIKFKEIIEWWNLTADDLERIVNDIYAEDEIPHFFRHMQDDFQETYLELKQSTKKLLKEDIPEMPKDSETKEYKISLGNIYKKVEQDEKGEKGEPKPDPLKLDLNAHAELEVKEKAIRDTSN